MPAHKMPWRGLLSLLLLELAIVIGWWGLPDKTGTHATVSRIALISLQVLWVAALAELVTGHVRRRRQSEPS